MGAEEVKFGFRSDEEYDEPEPPNYGIGHAGGVSDPESSGSNEPGVIVFQHHLYFSVQIGPFVFALGRPE